MANTAAQPKQFDLPSGTMLGKYEILKKLAMGGMAEIYLARVRGTAGFEKMVVIKRILPTVADDPKFVRMFLDEARLAATLHHPNIADVHEVGEHSGSPFFAMEFVHGQDVRGIRVAARNAKERVPLAIALAIVHGTASALDYAHDRTGPDGQNLNLVHRDVSSSNILVSYEGAIKLIDFGIARAASSQHQTQVGTLKGKIPYMSPEQCRGTPLDRRSDLFSLGVVMYELTVGRRPFHGENDFQIMDQIVHQGAQPPSALMTGYPPELEAIVMKLLARKADERYQTAEEMLHDLDPFLAQHRLWVSPKPLSRYMRTLFANEVSAWDKALSEGTSLDEHLAKTVVSSQSKPSALLTPPSSFPTPMPLSQEMPAVAMQTSNFAKAEPEKPAVAAAPPPAPVEPSYPEAPVEKRTGRAVLLGLVGAAVLGAGAFFGVTALKKKPAATAPSAGSAESVQMTPVKPEPTTEVKPETPKEVKADPEPLKTEPPKTEPPKQEPATPEHAGSAEEVAETPPETKPDPKKPKVQKVVVKKPVVKATTPTSTQTKPPDTSKDQGWDPNSPFLPSSK